MIDSKSAGRKIEFIACGTRYASRPALSRQGRGHSCKLRFCPLPWRERADADRRPGEGGVLRMTRPILHPML
jgi:hypothetical protein